MTRFDPTTEAELIEAVARAAQERAALEISGAGSKQGLGRPVEATHQLRLGALAGITLYEPAELVLSARAGTPLAEIEAQLAANLQQLAFEPADLGPLLGQPAGGGTVGGMVACNLSGPRRIKAGAVRDHVLGVRAVSGRGEVYKSGGRVVKNVTGYDLAKLLTGAHGTLSVLTEVTLKVLPRPETERTLILRGLDDAAALAAMTSAMGSAHEVSGAAHLPAAVAARLGLDESTMTALRLEGPRPSVAARFDGLRAQLGSGEALTDEPSQSLWSAIRDVTALVDLPERLVWRLSVPPQCGPRTVAAIVAAVPEALAYYDWAGGLIWLAMPAAEDGHHELVRAALGPTGGHATLIRAPEATRTTIPVFQPQTPALAALTARVKESFDPLRILNPGRIYPGI